MQEGLRGAVLTFLAVAAYGAFHSLLASPWAKRLARPPSLPLGAPSALHRRPGLHLVHSVDEHQPPGPQPGPHRLHLHRQRLGGTAPHLRVWRSLPRLFPPDPPPHPTTRAPAPRPRPPP